MFLLIIEIISHVENRKNLFEILTIFEHAQKPLINFVNCGF